MDIGKMLMIVGVMLLVVGGIFTFFGGISGIPRLPGDIYIKRDNFTFYFPIVSSIIISIILSLVLQFFFRK
jgi:uncharacterized membrane-anchored protein YitT (DUF2179 family)